MEKLPCVELFCHQARDIPEAPLNECFPLLDRIVAPQFNKSVSEDARKRFPHNVYCRTMNSVAYQEMGGSRYKSNEGQFICRVSELKLFLEKNNPKPVSHGI